MKAVELVWVVPLLLTQCCGLESDPLPRKANLVTRYLDKMLNSAFTDLTTSGITIPEIDLGEETGKFSKVVITVPGKIEKHLDGVQSFGFKLNTNFSRIVVKGLYDVVNLDVPGLFPFFGKGKFCVGLDVVNLDMKLTAVYSVVDEKFDINIPDFQVLIENSTVNFENLMDDPHLSDFLNELLSKLLPDVVKTLLKPLLDFASPIVEYFGNGIIKCIKEGALLGNTDECIRNLFGFNFSTQEKLKLTLKNLTLRNK